MRAAERGERAAACGQAIVADPIAAALDLVRLAGRLQGWPVPADPVSVREALEMYDTWARLRRRMRPS